MFITLGTDLLNGESRECHDESRFARTNDEDGKMSFDLARDMFKEMERLESVGVYTAFRSNDKGEPKRDELGYFILYKLL